MATYANYNEAFNTCKTRKKKTSSSGSIRAERPYQGDFNDNYYVNEQPSSYEGNSPQPDSKMTWGDRSQVYGNATNANAYVDSSRGQPNLNVNPLQSGNNNYSNNNINYSNANANANTSTNTGDYADCLDLINQVMQNITCKRILRNILLEEYLDTLFKYQVDRLQVGNLSQPTRSSPTIAGLSNSQSYTYAAMPQSGGIGTGTGTSLNESFANKLTGLEQYFNNMTFFGLDVKTLIIVFMAAIVGLYLYDLVTRILFRS